MIINILNKCISQNIINHKYLEGKIETLKIIDFMMNNTVFKKVISCVWINLGQFDLIAFFEVSTIK